MSARLTQRELRALAKACAFQLASDPDDDPYDVEALTSAHGKISDRVHWTNFEDEPASERPAWMDLGEMVPSLGATDGEAT